MYSFSFVAAKPLVLGQGRAFTFIPRDSLGVCKYLTVRSQRRPNFEYCSSSFQAEEPSNEHITKRKYEELHMNRRTFAALTSLLLLNGKNVLAESAENVDVTDTVFLDFSIAGRPAGRVKIGLFGKNSPITVKTFLKREGPILL